MTAKVIAKKLHLRFLLKLPFDKEVTTENKHGKWTYSSEELATEHAIICVDEMLKVIPMYTGTLNPKWELYTEVRSILEQS